MGGAQLGRCVLGVYGCAVVLGHLGRRFFGHLDVCSATKTAHTVLRMGDHAFIQQALSPEWR